MIIKIFKFFNNSLDKIKVFNAIRLKFYLNLYDYSYDKISRLSVEFNNGLHPKHSIMKYYQFFLNNIDNDSIILDIGCGIGYLAYKIAEKAKEVFAIDINKNYIEQAKIRFNRNNIKFLIADATNYNFTSTFDYIILSNVLEHIKNRHAFLNKIKPISKNFLIRVPMINRSWLTLYKKSLGLEYRLDKTHFIEYTFDSFKNEIESIGLKIVLYEIKFGEIWARVTK